MGEVNQEEKIRAYIRKLTFESYFIDDLETKEKELDIDNLQKHSILKDFNLTSKTLYGKKVIYDKDEIELKIYQNLYCLLNDLSDMVNRNNKNLVFRGHSDANYQLLSSLLRKDPNVEKESDYYFDIIKSYPERFINARYHLDYLKTMQHFGADTRILDISTNFLAPIYFSVENNNDKLGELIVFDKSLSKNNVKRLNSDTVEILASLAALDSELKKDIKKQAELVLKLHSHKGINEIIKIFNKKHSVRKLVHEVGQVRLNFKHEINPNHLLDAYYSDSTFDNERITNQAGEFIIHGLIDTDSLTENLNKWRYTEKKKRIIFLIAPTAKEDFRRDLKLLGIMKSTIYPSLENKINDIYDRK